MLVDDIEYDATDLSFHGMRLAKSLGPSCIPITSFAVRNFQLSTPILTSSVVPNRVLLRSIGSMSSKHQTLIEAVKHDHQEMYEYHDEYKKAAGNPDAQARWARQLTWEIARHAVGEEIVIYPLMEQYLGAEGKRLADQDRNDHQLVKEKLYHLEKLVPGTAEYDSTIAQVMASLHRHNDGEEINDLPQLEPLLGADGSRDAAASFTRTKKFAPTRPHPSAPNKPPAETLAGFLALPMDKLKDMFAKFPTEEMKAGDK